MDILLRRTLHFVYLRRIFYLVSSRRTRGHKLELSHPARAEFVICDCFIENGLHYRRDTTLREDHSQLRMGHARHLLVSNNNMTIGLVARHRSTNLAEARCEFAYQLDKALATLAI